MRPAPVLLALLLIMPAAAAAAPQGADSAAPESPLFVARADGGWTITREIREEPPALALVTDGLLLGEGEAEPVRIGENDRRIEEEQAESIDRAFEEAVDFAREANRTQPRD